MRKITIQFILLILFVSCTYEKSSITDEMKLGLISFEQELIGYDTQTEKERNGKVVTIKDGGILTFTYITEETGCPDYKGGYEIVDKTLILYYQDVNFRLVKCIDFYKLEYKIADKNLDYNKIKIVRLKPIKEGFNF